MKKLTEENKKFTDEANLNASGKIGKSFVNNPSEVENLKRQIRLLEQKVRNQRPEKPLSETKVNFKHLRVFFFIKFVLQYFIKNQKKIEIM